MAAEADALERVRAVEKNAAASLASWNFGRINMVHEGDEACAAVECLNTYLKALRKQVSGHVIV